MDLSSSYSEKVRTAGVQKECIDRFHSEDTCAKVSDSRSKEYAS